MPDFNLKQLEAFAAAAECNSFTQAAQRLYLTQSTVSAHIRGLEMALGVQLFDREAKKKLRLTEAGKAVYPRAKAILEQCHALEEAVRPDDTEEVLSLAASTVPCQCLLPRLMAEFLSVHPGCRYHLQKGDSAQVHDLLRRQEVHIGFAGTQLDPEQFRYTPLVRDKLVLLTANTPRFQALRQSGASGLTLLSEPLICREPGSGTRRQFEACLRQAGLDPSALQVVAQIDQPDAILSAVASGVGVAPYSQLAAQTALEDGRVLDFTLGQDGFVRDLFLVTPMHSALSPLEDAFVRMVLRQYLPK